MGKRVSISYKLDNNREEYVGDFPDNSKSIKEAKERHTNIRKGLGLNG